ncbi:uncharacterized protein LOC144135462 [Amblyomma americanum]
MQPPVPTRGPLPPSGPPSPPVVPPGPPGPVPPGPAPPGPAAPGPAPPGPVPPGPVPPGPVTRRFTTVRPSNRYRELVCTVNRFATTWAVYPPDGLCHYLYYGLVFVVEEQVRATTSPVSYDAFLSVARGYNVTGAGIAFHTRYTNAETVTGNVSAEMNIATHLKLLRMNFRVVHYGFINVIARMKAMPPLVNKVLKVLKILKDYQKSFETVEPFDDYVGKTILGLGLFRYNEINAWRQYKELLQKLTTYDYVNTVIALTTTVTLEDFGNCKTVPPDVLRTKDRAYAELIRHGELMKESSPDIGPDAIFGLSLEMGAAFYYLQRSYDTLQMTTYVSPCEYRGFTNLDSTCEEGDIYRLPQSSNVAFGSTIYKLRRPDAPRSYVYFWESKVTLFEKLDFLEALPMRQRFSWLYLDVNLADFTGQCTESPWQNIQEFKTAFDMGSTPEEGSS